MNTQFVIFRLGDDVYGADIYNIHEIIFPKEPVKVPNNPEFIEGVIEYRGVMVPVLDLKRRFDIGTTDFTGQTRLVIGEVGEGLVAFSVDEVTEILRVEREQLRDVPEMAKIAKEYIKGATRSGDEIVIILDLAKVLTVDERDILKSI